jgi:hypothetical protein
MLRMLASVRCLRFWDEAAGPLSHCMGASGFKRWGRKGVSGVRQKIGPGYLAPDGAYGAQVRAGALAAGVAV